MPCYRRRSTPTDPATHPTLNPTALTSTDPDQLSHSSHLPPHHKPNNLPLQSRKKALHHAVGPYHSLTVSPTTLKIGYPSRWLYDPNRQYSIRQTARTLSRNINGRYSAVDRWYRQPEMHEQFEVRGSMVTGWVRRGGGTGGGGGGGRGRGGGEVIWEGRGLGSPGVWRGEMGSDR